MKSQRLPQNLPGASNFRSMAGARVYGVAMSTVGGIRNVLRAVGEQARAENEVGGVSQLCPLGLLGCGLAS